MEREVLTECREENGFTRSYEFHPVVAEHLLVSGEVETEPVYQDEFDELIRMTFPSGAQLVAHWKPMPDSIGPELFAKPDRELNPTQQDIADAFWSRSDHLEMVRKHESVAFETFEVRDVDYDGQEQDLIERWRRSIDDGTHRLAFLYGPPNSGKTTFCKNAACELGRRVLRLDYMHVVFQRLPEWTRVLERVSPDVVIADGFGGLGSPDSRYAGRTSLIEFLDQCGESELTLLTEQIDGVDESVELSDGLAVEFVEIEGIGKPEYSKRVLELAEEYGIEVPEEELPELTEILKGFGEPSVVEAFNRAAVFGWEELEFDPFEYSMSSVQRDRS